MDHVQEQLSEYRRQLDKIDTQLLAVLQERFEVTENVGLLKAAHNLPSVDEKRELDKIHAFCRQGTELGLPASLTSDIIRQIMSHSVQRHQQLKAQRPARAKTR